ncbi:MAG: phosphodiester glycosidase family protein [Acidobacteriota bacterium]|nr:phosphodiester glycosidase family protein [Acidobacteriota bacterium]
MTHPARSFWAALWMICGASPALLHGSEIVTNPFVGITLITRTESSPRTENMHIAEISLTAPGIRFELTSPGGTLETVRQTTLGFLNQEHAQLAINSHFFLPYPSSDSNAMLIGLAASNGNVYSSFEAPVQSYAIAPNAPALNLDSSNHAAIVHNNTNFGDGKHLRENVTLWNSLAGSAQIITNGAKSIPTYVDATHPDGLLTPGGPGNYSNTHTWYGVTNARTVIGLSKDNQTLFLFTVDNAGGSRGMALGEVADLLIQDYGVFNALNLDGGGSTTMAMQNEITGLGSIINVSSDNPNGRAVGSNLAVFAEPIPELPSFILEGTGIHRGKSGAIIVFQGE